MKRWFWKNDSFSEYWKLKWMTLIYLAIFFASFWDWALKLWGFTIIENLNWSNYKIHPLSKIPNGAKTNVSFSLKTDFPIVFFIGRTLRLLLVRPDQIRYRRFSRFLLWKWSYCNGSVNANRKTGGLLCLCAVAEPTVACRFPEFRCKVCANDLIHLTLKNSRFLALSEEIKLSP